MNNPGLSPEAWRKLHQLLAKSNAKYANEIAEARRKKAEEEKDIGKTDAPKVGVVET